MDKLCNEKLKQLMRTNLGSFQVRTHSHAGVQRAAVALTIVDVAHGSDDYGLPSFKTRQPDAALILTRRSTNLRNHSGQWALPGGRRDQNEDPAGTALRELSEEVGLDLAPDRVIGYLDDFTTRSGFVITPVVIWGGDQVDLVANPAEVASIHRIPLVEFLRKDAPLIENSPGSKAPLLLMPFETPALPPRPRQCFINFGRWPCWGGIHGWRILSSHPLHGSDTKGSRVQG